MERLLQRLPNLPAAATGPRATGGSSGKGLPCSPSGALGGPFGALEQGSSFRGSCNLASVVAERAGKGVWGPSCQNEG